MNDATQKIRDYIEKYEKDLKETLVTAFKSDIDRFKDILNDAGIEIDWSESMANDLQIKRFVNNSKTRYSGKNILDAYRGFLKCLESNEVLEQAIGYFESVLPESPDDSRENSEGETEWDQYNDTFAGERFDKTRRFGKITAILNGRVPLSALCTKNMEKKEEESDECDLYKDTIGIGQDIRQFDCRTGKILHVVAMLEEVRSSAVDVGKENKWRTTIGTLNVKISSFFSDIGRDVLETKTLDTLNITNETKTALKDMVEDPSIKNEVDRFVDSLVSFQKQHTLTTMFLHNKVTRKKENREFLSSVAGLPICITKIQNEMFANTRSDCEIAAGAIHFGIRENPKIKEYDKVPFKIVATSQRSRAVLQKIGVL